MSAAPPRDPEVIIAGAGPTGLVLALWLARLGVRARIVDKSAAPGATSRALAIQARTLEFYRQAGLADEVVERGRKIAAVNLQASGRLAARLAFGDIDARLSPYPYVLIFPQDEHERLLAERLAAAGVEVERGTELLGFEETPAGIRARLSSPDGATQECRAAYIAGCDGAHSTVREALKIGFPGGAYEHLYYVADVEAAGDAIDDEVRVALDTEDFLAVFPLKASGHARLVGTVRDARRSPAELSWEDVSQRAIERMAVEVRRVNWFSAYRVHHRVADSFRAGRAFLLGDAGHIHSPVGGQGMNTGIGDAVNLAWKLAAVLKGRANPALLDTYEPERIAFARRLVATTDRVFTGVSSSAATARVLRMEVAPRVLPVAFRFAAVRRLMFRLVSQTAINYRTSALSEGSAGAIRGGDRLPWVAADGRASDNFAPLCSLGWQLHVYGETPADLRGACEARRLPLHVFGWRPAMESAGFQRDGAYLVRPDGYVALAHAGGGGAAAAALASYLEARGLAG